MFVCDRVVCVSVRAGTVCVSVHAGNLCVDGVTSCEICGTHVSLFAMELWWTWLCGLLFITVLSFDMTELLPVAAAIEI